MKDVTSIGEAMLRLSVPAGVRISQAASFNVHLGGAESNVLAALAALDRSCGWVSRVPDSHLGNLVLSTMRRAGVDITSVHVASKTRQATYFVEFGTPPRPTEVVYDRMESAAAGMTADAIPWKYLLATRLLHLTGITPALSRTCTEVCERAIERAREAHVPICFDVNYRSKLWSADRAGEWIQKHATYLEIFICGRDDAELLFNLSGDDESILAGLAKLFSANNTVLTLGSDGALAAVGDEIVRVAPYPAAVLDRLGAGDAFAAGVIDGWLDGDLEAGLKRGAVLGSLALAQYGDMLTTNRDELDKLLEESATFGSTSTQVSR